MPEQKTQTVMPAFDSASSLHDTWPLYYGLSAQVPSVVGQRVSNDQVHTEGAGPNLRGIGDRMKSRSPVLSMSTSSRLRWLHCVKSPDACLRASDQGSQGRASAASNFPSPAIPPTSSASPTTRPTTCPDRGEAHFLTPAAWTCL